MPRKVCTNNFKGKQLHLKTFAQHNILNTVDRCRHHNNLRQYINIGQNERSI